MNMLTSAPLSFGIPPVNRRALVSAEWIGKSRAGVMMNKLNNHNIVAVTSTCGDVKGEEWQGRSLVSSTTSPFIFSKMSEFNKLGFQPSPELGLISLLFVLSTAIGAIFSLAVISIPSLLAFKNLAVSMDKLSKVASEEVPGTLSSLKLSGLEINELTQKLSNLRHKLGGKNQHGEKNERRKKSGAA